MLSRRHLALVCVVLGLGLLLSGPLSAQAYNIHLKNGNTFVSKYRPVLAPYDNDKLLIMTEVGNVISIHKADLEDVVSDIENRGFGIQIDTVTILLGFTQGPGLTDEELEAAAEAAANAPPRPPPTPAVFTNPTFGEPNSGGGIPVNFINTTTPPISNPRRN